MPTAPGQDRRESPADYSRRATGGIYGGLAQQTGGRSPSFRNTVYQMHETTARAVGQRRSHAEINASGFWTPGQMNTNEFGDPKERPQNLSSRSKVSFVFFLTWRVAQVGHPRYPRQRALLVTGYLRGAHWVVWVGAGWMSACCGRTAVPVCCLAGVQNWTKRLQVCQERCAQDSSLTSRSSLRTHRKHQCTFSTNHFCFAGTVQFDSGMGLWIYFRLTGTGRVLAF